MKKNFSLKRRGIVFALVSLLCVLSIKAQTWTAPSLTGSTPTTGSTYYLYNVGSNGYLNRGGWWAFQSVVSAAPRANASTSVVKWTATNTSGSTWTFQYNLNGSDVANNFLFCSNSSDGSIFTDNSTDNTWDVVQTDAVNNIYSIQVVSTYAGYSATQYLGTASTTESTNKGIANTVRYNRPSGDSYTQWKFVSQADLDLYNAKVLLDKYMTYGKNKGMDVSSYVTTYNAGVTADINTAAGNLLTALGRTDVSTSITNPSFETNSFTGWTNGGFQTQSNAPGQGWTKAGTYYAEKWTSGGGNLAAMTLTQTVTGLSNGLYGLTVSGHAVQQGGSNPLHSGAYITAGSASTEVVAGQDYSIDNITVANGSLTIGYKLQAPIACNWIGFDNFQLYYYGPAAIPAITPSTTDFAFNAGDDYLSDSLTVSGLNLSETISISAPSGITVSPTSLPSNASGAKVFVTYDGVTSVSGNITFTSGSTTVNVTVSGGGTAGCYTPLHPTGNLIADPRFSASTLGAGGFGGWGPTGISHTHSYCGAGSAYVRGSCWPDGGSIDRSLNTANGNALKPNTLYRLRAMVNSQAAAGKSFQFQIEGVDGSASIYFPLENTNGWVQLDTTFTTGATVTEHGIYFNSCSNPPAVTDTCFIDNYELYEEDIYVSVKGIKSDLGQKIYIQKGKIVADFNLKMASDVEFAIYNAQGVLVAKERASYDAGQKHKVFNTNLTPGVYLVRLVSEGKTVTTKVLR